MGNKLNCLWSLVAQRKTDMQNIFSSIVEWLVFDVCFHELKAIGCSWLLFLFSLFLHVSSLIHLDFQATHYFSKIFLFLFLLSLPICLFQHECCSLALLHQPTLNPQVKAMPSNKRSSLSQHWMCQLMCIYVHTDTHFPDVMKCPCSMLPETVWTILFAVYCIVYLSVSHTWLQIP